MDESWFYTSVIFLGLAALVLMSFSFLSGMRIIKFKPQFRIHKRIGIAGFICAAIHGLIMLYFYFFS